MAGVIKVSARSSDPRYHIATTDGFTGGFQADVNIGRKNPLFFSLGLRAMLQTYKVRTTHDTLSRPLYYMNSVEGQLALPVAGVQLKLPLGPRVHFRTGAFLGASLITNGHNSGSVVLSEYAAGFMFGNRITLGAKLFLPLTDFNDERNVFSLVPASYRSMSITGELKYSLRPPNRREFERMSPSREIGVSVGPVLATETEHSPTADRVHGGVILRGEVDYHFDKRGRRVYPYFGLRGGGMIVSETLIGVLGAIGGVQWLQPVNEELSLRVNAGVAPSAGIYFLLSGAYANLAPEAGVALQFNKRVAVGLRYSHPFGEFETWDERGRSYTGSDYTIALPMIEVKFRPGG
jgi:hypothetical protein